MTEMITDMVPFDFNGVEVRAIIDELGEPWFVAKDVADVLGYSRTSAMTQSLDGDEKGVRDLDTPGGVQSLTIISESGVFAAVLRSQRPEAKVFRKWVTTEVLPSIRKTGSYSLANLSPVGRVVAMGQAMLALEKRQAEQQKEIVYCAARIERIEVEHEILSGQMEQYSIKAYAALKSIPINRKDATRLGKSVSLLTRRGGLRKGEVRDPVYGKVGAYDADVLEQVFDEYFGADDLSEVAH
jgi:anti-repressor protein